MRPGESRMSEWLADAGLRELAAQHQAILNNIPDMAWLRTPDSRFIAVNQAYVEASGHPQDELLGRRPDAIWPAELAQAYLATDQEVVRTGRRTRYEHRVPDISGAMQSCETIKTPVCNSRGEIIGITGISRNITERKRAEEAVARLNLLYTVRGQTSQAIVRIADRHRLLQEACRITVRSGALAMAWAGLFDTAGNLVPAACHAEQKRRCGPVTDAAAADIRKIRSRRFQHYVCNDAASTRQFQAHARLAEAQGCRSFAIFPLRLRGRAAGLFAVYARETTFFTDDIVQLLAALSADLSFALNSIAEADRRRQAEQALLASRARLRELSAYLESVREAERTRIARELHDELGQNLTALKMGLGWVEKQLLPAQEKARGKVRHLKELADLTVHSIQQIAADLRPMILDELGLESAIEWQLERFSEQSGIAFELKIQHPRVTCSHDARTAIFRILQEAITNVGRHAQASRVIVTLLVRDDAMHLAVQDNGTGFDPALRTEREALGLLGMRERAHTLGGTLAIHSRPGYGTRIEASIPIDGGEK